LDIGGAGILFIFIQHNIVEKKNYTDLKKAAENRSIWRTIKRDCHKPAPEADNSMMMNMVEFNNKYKISKQKDITMNNT